MSIYSPGWYQDPDGPGQRFHDGTRWTDAIRVQSDSPTAGYIWAALVPFVGFVVGIVYSAGQRPNRRSHGPVVILVSVLSFVAWSALITQMGL